MKKSKYNILYNHCGKKFIFNAMTCALAQYGKDFYEIYSSIEDIDTNKLEQSKKELVNVMKKGGYIIEDDFDELAFLKFNSYKSKFSRKGFTIAPTLECNFACPYCYETTAAGIIKDEVIDAIYKKVESFAVKNEHISVCWYGGEPLIAKDKIFKMSKKMIEICDKSGANYDSNIVTNGYLINEDVAQKMIDAKISAAQITIDGPPDIHNARRKLKCSSAPTFDNIVNNIKLLEKKHIKVSIRINVDKTNIDHLEGLLDIFVEHKLNSCIVYLGHVEACTDACMSISDTCFAREQYASENIKFQKMLHKKGLNSTARYPYYPRAKSNFCGADSFLSFVVDPNGSLYKCWHDIGRIGKIVGNILTVDNQDTKINMLLINYILCTPFDHQECIECEILPLCMGGCPTMRMSKSKNPRCATWKYNIIDVLKMTYDHQISRLKSDHQCNA